MAPNLGLVNLVCVRNEASKYVPLRLLKYSHLRSNRLTNFIKPSYSVIAMNTNQVELLTALRLERAGMDTLILGKTRELWHKYIQCNASREPEYGYLNLVAHLEDWALIGYTGEGIEGVPQCRPT